MHQWNSYNPFASAIFILWNYLHELNQATSKLICINHWIRMQSWTPLRAHITKVSESLRVRDSGPLSQYLIWWMKQTYDRECRFIQIFAYHVIHQIVFPVIWIPKFNSKVSFTVADHVYSIFSMCQFIFKSLFREWIPEN